MKSWYAAGLVISLMISSRLIVSEGIWLNLPNTGTKCVSEEIQNNVVVVADYVVIDEHGHATPTVSAKIAWHWVAQ
ncbi:Transmembrane emp24 domain-containing protein p24delta3 [Bienertia sinuspersici]